MVCETWYSLLCQPTLRHFGSLCTEDHDEVHVLALGEHLAEARVRSWNVKLFARVHERSG